MNHLLLVCRSESPVTGVGVYYRLHELGIAAYYLSEVQVHGGHTVTAEELVHAPHLLPLHELASGRSHVHGTQQVGRVGELVSDLLVRQLLHWVHQQPPLPLQPLPL